MKLLLSAGVLFMALTAMAGNLVQNGDFSKGQESWKQCEWQKEFLVVEDEISPERGNVMQMRRTARFADWSDTNAAIQYIPLSSPWQGAFRFSLDARVSDNAEGYPLAVVNLSFADGSSSSSNAFRVNAGKQWEHLEFLVPRDHAAVTGASISITFRGVGTAAFDNFCLEEVEASADLSLVKAVPLSCVFGDRGIAFTAETHENVKYTLDVLNSSGEVIGHQSDEGRNLQALFPEITDADCIRITLSEPYGDAQRSYEFALNEATKAEFRPYAVFTADSMQKIMPGQMPTNNGLSLDISLAGNEHEACQIALRRFPGTDIGNVSVHFSDFIDDSNGNVFPADGLSFYQIGLVQVKQMIPHPANPWSQAGWWPDALLPVKKVKIPDDNTFGIWIDVAAPENLPAGTYTGQVTLAPDNADAVTVPMSIRVYPFSLPLRPAMPTAFGIFWKDIRNVYGAERFDAIRRKYIEYIIDRRISPSDLYLTELEDPDIMSDLAPRINTYNAAVSVNGKDSEFMEWADHIAKVKASPFAEDAYFYGFDEFKDEARGKVRETFARLKELYPGIKTFATSTAVDITADAMRDLNLDWLCVMVDYYDYEKAARLRAENPDLKVWGYISFQPGYPYVNYMLEYPLIESRLFAWQVFNYDMDGFLYWNLNYYAQKGCESATRIPVNPEDGPYVAWSKRTGVDGEIFAELNGDGKILYYGVDGPIGSIVLENIRDGLEDYDYLKLARDQAAAKKISTDISPSLTQFSRSPEHLRAAREKLAALIAGK